MKRILVITLSLILFSGVSNAQMGGLLRKAQNQAERSLNKRLEKEVEKKVDEEVNKAVDKALDEAEKEVADSTKQTQKQDQSQTRSQEERVTAIMQSMGVGVDIEHRDIYTFNAEMKMILEHTDQNGTQDTPVMYNSYFDSERPDYAIQFKNEEGQQSHFIFDAENKCSLILSDSGTEKTGVATSIGEEDIKNWIDDETQAKIENTQYIKTGKTKTISGFKCHEYLYETQEEKTSLWLTNDLKNKINRSLYKSSVLAGSTIHSGISEGVMIQHDFQSKTSKEKSLMTVTSIDFKAKHSINTTPYQIMGIRVAQ